MKQAENELDLTEIMERIGSEEKARELIEQLRWPNGPVCPHCRSTAVYRLSGKEESENPGRSGLLKCGKCRKQFTVTVGTIFENSHIPLNKWLMSIYLICSSKKGISANQLHRLLGITYKSTWFMAHRIRFAMSKQPLADKLKRIIEADETYVCGRFLGKKGRGAGNKTKVFSLIQRDGEARSFQVDDVKGKTLKSIIRNNVVDTAHVMTDEFAAYYGLESVVANHSTVSHGNKEYVRGIVHTNFAESYFSLLKSGILGTFHHVSEEHMQRYLGEFDYRWTRRDEDDGLNTMTAIKGVRWLRYRDSSSCAKLN